MTILGRRPTPRRRARGRRSTKTALGGDRLGVEVVGRAQHGHEQLCLDGDRSGPSVVDRETLAGEVDEELLAGAVLLAHHQIHMSLPGPVVQTELRVAVAVVGWASLYSIHNNISVTPGRRSSRWT